MCKYCESTPMFGATATHCDPAHYPGPSAVDTCPAGTVRRTPDKSPGKKNSAPRRRRLWELESDLHCAVIGTCAPVSELRRIYRKINGRAADDFSDYQMHNLFVRSTPGEHDGIKLLHKSLDARYRSTIRRYSQAYDEDALEAQWQASLDSGEVAAGYWALTTHPLITDQLNGRAFGEVHMLSHLAGRSWQQESVRRREAEARHDAARRRLREVEDALQQSRKSLDRQGAEGERLKLRVIQQQEVIARLEEQVSDLYTRTGEDQERIISRLKARIQSLEEAGRVPADSQDRVAPAVDARNESTLEELRRANHALEERLASLLNRRNKPAACPAQDCDGLNLAGQCILYVGGRGRIQGQFRRLVEAMNGTFLYHDGGREDNHHRLPSLVSRADTVFCPVTCVSHSAAIEVRKVCEHQIKPAVWLQAPSLSAFNAALEELAVRAPDVSSH